VTNPKYLLVGSIEAYTGKSATILGMADRLLQAGVDLAYGKPLGTCFSDDTDTDEDVQFLPQLLGLSADRVRGPLVALRPHTVRSRLQGKDTTDYGRSLVESMAVTDADVVLLEGPGTLDEGCAFGLALPQMAATLDAKVVLVVRDREAFTVDPLLCAREQLGDRLLGAVINDIPPVALDEMKGVIQPFLEERGIPILALMPSSPILRGISVAELVRQLKADILCCDDRQDLMVETLQIGAMSVNAAVKYFSGARNMAVVTGGDRYDIQLAALEASTHCLILTGRLKPLPKVLDRAREMEIPVLSVDLNTLETVEIIDSSFGQVRLQEPIKVECVKQMTAEYFDVDRLRALLSQ